MKPKKQGRAGSKVLKKKMVKKKRSTEKKVKGGNVKLELKPVNGEKETKLDFNLDVEVDPKTQGAAHQPHRESGTCAFDGFGD